MKIVRARQHHEHREHRLVFERVGSGGAGFSFPCDKAGHVNEASLPRAARDNYRACLAGRGGVVPQGVAETEHSWWEPAIGECEGCGQDVILCGFTNTCERCDADYNGSGQLLAPRECWSEGTGESLADILSIDSASTDELFE